MRGHLLRAMAKGPWTPASIATALWFDAADSATITLNGSNVSQWSDKSGNGRHIVQATSGAQPAVTSQLNGKNVVSFDGGDVLASSDNVPVGLSSRTVFFVAKENVAVDYAGILTIAPSLGDDYLSQSGLSFVFTGNEFGHGVIRVNALPSMAYDHNTPALGTLAPYSVFCEVFNSGTGTLYKNGASVSLQTPAGSFAANSTGKIVVGGRFLSGSISGGYRLNGNVAEIIHCSPSLSIADRQRTEGYLAHKWGLASDLPSDHPYKASPP